MVADDLGYNDVSWHNPRIKTPVLQELVDGGVRLSRFHTWKACAPSRGCMMSGRYPFHFGFYTNQDANAYGAPISPPPPNLKFPSADMRHSSIHMLARSGFATLLRH